MTSRLPRWVSGQYRPITMWSPMPAATLSAGIEAGLAEEKSQHQQESWAEFSGLASKPWIARRHWNSDLILSVRGTNKWYPEAVVEIVPQATGGTQLRLRPRLSPFVMAYVWSLIGIVAVIALGTLLAGAMVAAAVFAGIVVFLVGGSLVTRVASRKELDFLCQWLAWYAGGADEIDPTR